MGKIKKKEIETRDEIKMFIEKVSSYKAEALGVKEPRIRYAGKNLMVTDTAKAKTSDICDEIKSIKGGLCFRLFYL